MFSTNRFEEYCSAIYYNTNLEKEHSSALIHKWEGLLHFDEITLICLF